MSEIPDAVAAYYASAEQPHQSTLVQLRARILSVVPEATEVMKYNMPTFTLDGRPVCGIMAHTRHIGYYPYSGSVLSKLPELTAKYGGTKGALHLPIDAAIPLSEIRALITAKFDIA